MPTIKKMNINSSPYDIGGGGNTTIYYGGDGIEIDPDGRISVIISEGISPEELEALRQELAEAKLMFSGELNTVTGEIEEGAYIMTYLNSEVAGIKMRVWDSEDMWTAIDMLPGEVTAEITAAWTSEGGRYTKLDHKIDITAGATRDTILQLVDSEGGWVRKNDFYRDVGSLISDIEMLDSEDTRLWSRISQFPDEIRAEVAKQTSEGSAIGSMIKQTADSIESTVSKEINSLTSEGGVIDRMQSTFTQNYNGFVATVTSQVNGINNTTSNLTKQMSFDSTGLKIAASNISTAKSYTKITESGMEIWSNNKKVAEATDSIFRCNNGLGVNDWIISVSTGTLGNKVLNFYRG